VRSQPPPPPPARAQVDVLGLTTTFGNCPTSMATANALHLCEMAGRADLPVAQVSMISST